MSAEPTRTPEPPTPAVVDEGVRSTLDLCGLGWSDVLMVLDGLQLAGIEHHRQAVLATDPTAQAASRTLAAHADALHQLIDAHLRHLDDDPAGPHIRLHLTRIHP